jgi:hypothetical protein
LIHGRRELGVPSLSLKQSEHKNNEEYVPMVRQSQYRGSGGSVALIKAVRDRSIGDCVTMVKEVSIVSSEVKILNKGHLMLGLVR